MGGMAFKLEGLVSRGCLGCGRADVLLPFHSSGFLFALARNRLGLLFSGTWFAKIHPFARLWLFGFN